jgi:hypothetical protein
MRLLNEFLSYPAVILIISSSQEKSFENTSPELVNEQIKLTEIRLSIRSVDHEGLIEMKKR